MKQRTEEWFEARLGCVTASMAYLFNNPIPNKTKQNYKFQLIQERLTNTRLPEKTTKDQFIGREREGDARNFYANQYVYVDECGFIPHPTIKYSGASPDGLIGHEGLIEIKCPNEKNHDQYLKLEKVPAKYFYQIQFQLACTQRNWCDFVSFNPNFDPNNKIKVIRVYQDQDLIQKLESNIQQFLNEVDLIVKEKLASNKDILNQYL